ncbi:sulfur transferase domain-containing protein [uncultured Bosea sp.]|uniref:fused DSP-PTPase phosphatase/NAD kinase-like protein n=1 Tax=uncultured Bosea sp. TaxID=211457 RepID=UPI0025D68B21|nr:sulfur transferase domain-containing protein [uncultured Bosea sp.]
MLSRMRPDEERYARRMARIARWDRPIEGRGQRLRAWANMILVDHGIFRLAYLNAHRVTPRLWRSAQPAPGQIAAFARKGVKTIVNLRGGREHGSWPLQKEACERHGIQLVDFVLRSRGAPDRKTILGAKAFFESLDEPALVHCKSGADRAGFFSALYLLVHEGRPLDEAMRQLALRYGHFRFAKTGILDAFFEAYRREGEVKGIPFLDWVATIYDPERLEREFKPGLFSSLIADRLIRRE